MKHVLAAALLSLTLISCTSHTQTSSGAEYLASHKSDLPNTGDSAGFQQALKQAAAVEPTLRFPARIGLAKVSDGKLVSPSGDDMAQWTKLQQELGTGFGEMIPVNPMIAQSVTSALNAKDNNTINSIRLGAARQHLDAVLIYEVYSKSDHDNNLLSLISSLTLIGAYILPTDQVKAEGYASALLLDVMQGYPYGTIEAIVEKDDLRTTVAGARDNERGLKEKIEARATAKLAGEAGPMFRKLMTTLK